MITFKARKASKSSNECKALETFLMLRTRKGGLYLQTYKLNERLHLKTHFLLASAQMQIRQELLDLKITFFRLYIFTKPSLAYSTIPAHQDKKLL